MKYNKCKLNNKTHIRFIADFETTIIIPMRDHNSKLNKKEVPMCTCNITNLVGNLLRKTNNELELLE